MNKINRDTSKEKNKVIYALKQENRKLKIQNDRLSKRNSELRIENFELKDTIEKMKKEHDANNNINDERYCKDVMGCNMRMFRKKKKITQAQMARIIGVSTHTLIDVEHGRMYLNMESLIIFCNTVKIPMTYLFKKYDEWEYNVP